MIGVALSAMLISAVTFDDPAEEICRLMALSEVGPGVTIAGTDVKANVVTLQLDDGRSYSCEFRRNISTGAFEAVTPAPEDDYTYGYMKWLDLKEKIARVKGYPISPASTKLTAD